MSSSSEPGVWQLTIKTLPPKLEPEEEPRRQSALEILGRNEKTRGSEENVRRISTKPLIDNHHPPKPPSRLPGHKLYPRIEDGEPIKLPESLESLPKSDHFPGQRHRWNTNEEIASMLIAFDRHQDWLSKEVKIRPKSGSMLLYSRKKVRYRRDGYCWKKRKDGKTTREDHMKLKVQGMECIYGCYVHSAILPTFHRRCYWLLQNPDIVLVHYLNVPYPDDNKLVIASNVSLWGEKKEWTKEELISQLKPMFFSEEEPDLNNELEISTAETVEAIVTQLMEKQRTARAAALNKQMECGCPDSTNPDKPCPHYRKPAPTKSEAHTTTSSGRSRSGRSNNHHHHGHHQAQRMMEQRMQSHVAAAHRHHQENANQFYKTNSDNRYYTSYSQVSSTTDINSVEQRNKAMEVAHKLHNGDRLLIPLPPSESVHDSLENASSNSSSVTTSPVASAVRTLSNLSDFGNGMTDLHNSNYSDSYTGITDSLISATEDGGSSSHTRRIQQHHIPHHSHHIKTEKCEQQQQQPLMDFKSAFSDLDGHKPTDLSFLQETLDLGQEDMHHRALNLHHGSSSSSNNKHLTNGSKHHPDPMDFLNNHHHHPPGSSSTTSSSSSSNNNNNNATGSDQHFDVVGIDSFDMLNDFSDLHYHASSNPAETQSPPTSSNNNLGLLNHNIPSPMLSSAPTNNAGIVHAKPCSNNQDVHHGVNTRDHQHITDYNPDWSWQNGGTKILVTGPWYSSASQYQILFDGVPVPTVLVQSGVLRCFCPGHKPGRVQMQVACEGIVITPGVNFEYKVNYSGTNRRDEVESSESSEIVLKSTLLARLEGLYVSEKNDSPFESYLISLVDSLEREALQSVFESSTEMKSSPTKNIFHLSAILGLYQFIKVLLDVMSRFMQDNDVIIAQDDEGYTPLMRACANGHFQTALLLYERNRFAFRIRNYSGQSCLDVASTLVIKTELERLEKVRMGKEIEPKSTKMSSEADLSSLNNEELSLPIFKVQASSKAHLLKRSSFDSGIHLNVERKSSSGANNLIISRHDRSQSLPVTEHKSLRKNETTIIKCRDEDDEVIVDVEAISSDEETELLAPERKLANMEESDDQKVLTLAEQFIAAMPARIKNEKGIEDEPMLLCGDSDSGSIILPWESSQSDDPGVESMCDDLDLDFDFNFESECCSYREVYTPCSSVSPESSFCLQSPLSATLESPSPCLSRSFSIETAKSPPCTKADLQEFFQVSLKCERDLSKLTLSDSEQRELYEAAKIIQKAYRSYKGRQKNQDREAKAAVIIQNYYRRYKHYLYWRQISKAATLIQTKYRTYAEHKRFKKSQEAATCIQNYYRTYKGRNGTSSRESTPGAGLKRTYSQRRQNQAAKKIQQFMRKTQSKQVISKFRKSTITERGCYTCRKREAGPGSSSVVPAKLPGFSGGNHHGGHHHHQGGGYVNGYVNNPGGAAPTPPNSSSFYGWNNQQTVGR